MRRIAVLVLFFCVFAFAQSAFAESDETAEFRDLKERKVSNFQATLRGGYFLPEDSTYKEFYGKWSNDIYFFEMGYYLFKNISLLGSVGGYYQRGKTLGEITGAESGEDLTWTTLLLEAGAGYRFHYMEDQIVVPFVSVAYSWLYFHENADPGPVNDGWKTGFAPMGGIRILVDDLDPEAASNMKRRWDVEDTYLELSARYNFIGESGEVDMRGWVYMIGISQNF